MVAGEINEKETVESIRDESDIYMEFSSIKSIEVLILKLQQSRALILGIGIDTSGIKDITTIYEPNSIVEAKEVKKKMKGKVKLKMYKNFLRKIYDKI